MASAPFVRNLWYMAAWVHEVPDSGFLARRLLDVPRLIYRQTNGDYALLADRCPHRFVPLSRGKRIGDRIICGYHGLGFDATGQCVRTPFSGQQPPAVQIESLPVVARDGALWFWPGDREKADSNLIPDFSFIDAGAEVTRDYCRMEVDFQLIADNLMDLSHAEFLHVETFGVNGSLLSHGRHQVATDETRAIWSNWDIEGATPPDWAARMLPEGEKIDQWLHMRWHAPSAMALFIGIARAGTNRQSTLFPPMANPHILTPETAGTTHYFYTREPGEQSAQMARRVFMEEDEPMIRAQQAALDGQDFWDARPLVLAQDAAAIRARRRLKKMLAEEAAARG